MKVSKVIISRYSVSYLFGFSGVEFERLYDKVDMFRAIKDRYSKGSYSLEIELDECYCDLVEYNHKISDGVSIGRIEFGELMAE